MTREVSRRTSIPPEQKGKVVRPDMAITYTPPPPVVEQEEAIRRGGQMSDYLGQLNPTEGLSKSTGYVDNNNGPEPRGGKNAKRK